MTETLVELMQSVMDEDGRAFGVLACGEPTDIGTWHGWLEFVSTDGARFRSPRETTQPNRGDVIYWATGLTGTFIEGSFQRARDAASPRATRDRVGRRASSVRPAPSRSSNAPTAGRAEAVLNPFSVYAKGEPLLRSQLKALSRWHLVNIITAYRLSDMSGKTLNELAGTVLIDLIVDAVVANS